MTPEEFRRHGHRLIDWLADYQDGLADRPVMARTRPGEVRASVGALASEAGDIAAVWAAMRAAAEGRNAP